MHHALQAMSTLFAVIQTHNFVKDHSIFIWYIGLCMIWAIDWFIIKK